MIQLEANTDLTKDRGTLTNFDHAVLACAERVKKKIRPNAQLDRLCGEVAAKIAERDHLTAGKAANARDEADARIIERGLSDPSGKSPSR